MCKFQKLKPVELLLSLNIHAFTDFKINILGDYDNDDDLDIIFSGYNETSGKFTIIYKNNLNNPNTAPSAPEYLSSNVTGSTVILSWSSASDNETVPATGLNYNVRVGTTPGGIEITSPMSFASGKRLLSERGDIQPLFYKLRNLSPGTYYWSVQAIDTSFKGGAFSVERSFVIE